MNGLNHQVDTSWKHLYRMGAISAWLYVVLALVFPFFLYIDNTGLSHMYRGREIIHLIITNGKVWWVVLQTTVLCASFFAIITFAALFFALKNVEKSYAIVGSILAIVIHILFVAYYPVMLGLDYVADHYLTAIEMEKEELMAAAASLIAINNAFNPLYEAVFALSIFLLSVAMLKGVFRKLDAYLGFITAISAVVALSLWGVIGLGYFWWWLFFVMWFLIIGWRLFMLGWAK